MKFFVKTLAGTVVEVSLEPFNTVGDVKNYIVKKEGIPFSDQSIMFAGKVLQNEHTLESYNIRNECTLHVVVKTRPLEVTAKEKIASMKAAAEQGNFDFDDDIYILDPDEHINRLESAEKAVYDASEYRRCGGEYSLTDNTCENSTGWLWLSTNTSLKSAQIGNLSKFKDESFELQSMWKTLCITVQVLRSLDYLTGTGLYGTDYNLLLEHRGEGIAEIVRITKSDITSLLGGLERAILIALGVLSDQSIETAGQVSASITYVFCSSFYQIAEKLGCQSGINTVLHTGSTENSLKISRLLACILDLALVSYASSHVFLYKNKPSNLMDTVMIQITDSASFGFDFRLQRLACLDEFLDKNLVFVFTPKFEKGGEFPVKRSLSGLSILTYIKDFAELWGPVWPIPVAKYRRHQIQQYNVSKGALCCVDDRRSPAFRNAVRCHWYSWAEYNRRKASGFLPTDKESCFLETDLLLIGMRMRIEAECKYSLKDFEQDCGQQMVFLGASPSTWRNDQRSIGLSTSYFFGIQAMGTQKRYPQTPIKQLIWDKWTNNPKRANPEILSQFLGVEISHCTGNARRTPLKDLILLPEMQNLLETQKPGWKSTEWGIEFFGALRENIQRQGDIFIGEFNTLLSVWTRYSSYRTEMGELVCTVLDLLNATGKKNGQNYLTAAFPAKSSDDGVELSINGMEWAELLEDSHRTAVYAVVSKMCLNLEIPDHSGATCSQHIPRGDSRYTALDTVIATDRELNSTRIKLPPHDKVWKRIGPPDLYERIVITMEKSFLREGRLLSGSIQDGYEVRDQDQQMFSGYKTYCRSSEKGFGGIKLQRHVIKTDNVVSMDNIVSTDDSIYIDNSISTDNTVSMDNAVSVENSTSSPSYEFANTHATLSAEGSMGAGEQAGVTELVTEKERKLLRPNLKFFKVLLPKVRRRR